MPSSHNTPHMDDPERTGFPQIELMGIPIDSVTPDQVIDHLVAEVRHGRGGYVITPNTDYLRSFTRDPRLRRYALDATIRVADGMPLIWASILRGTPLPGRVAGSDLIVSLSLAAAAAGQSVFLLGGDPGTADGAARVLERLCPGLRIAGTHCPPLGFECSETELDLIRSLLGEASPDFVYLGLPFAKASALVGEARQVVPTAWFLVLGISFSFLTGHVSRAPFWMQSAGLEWLHRFVQEPGRLFRRYLLEGVPFAIRLLISALLERQGVRRAQLRSPSGTNPF
jgi:N-acetylglucosaminyldiphosphoundecaprenol N-acetyl-beta-D-mannosaminyltransferase